MIELCLCRLMVKKCRKIRKAVLLLFCEVVDATYRSVRGNPENKQSTFDVLVGECN